MNVSYKFLREYLLVETSGAGCCIDSTLARTKVFIATSYCSDNSSVATYGIQRVLLSAVVHYIVAVYYFLLDSF